MSLGGRCVDFFAAPYMLKLRFEQDLVPVCLSKESGGKDLLWQRTYGAYLIKLKKANAGEFFTNFEPENQERLVVPFEAMPVKAEVRVPAQ